jgi:hypothetical protein
MAQYEGEQAMAQYEGEQAMAQYEGEEPTMEAEARIIDEQSPDEDERQALQFIRAPIRSMTTATARSKRVLLSEGVS